MKQNLDESQTAKLIELGFEKPKIIVDSILKVDGQFKGMTRYTLGELLSFLPENIAQENEMPSTLNISLLDGEWCVEYADFLGADFSFRSVELIDALYFMCVRLKEEGVI